MKPDPLLEAVFSPREDTLRPVLQAARRRRVRRVIVRASCTVACLAAAAWFFIPRIPSLSTPATALTESSPAPAAPAVATIATIAMAPQETISSRPLAQNEVIRTQPSSVETISTASTASTLPTIADSELLALFEPGRVALIGEHASQRLVEY